MSSFIGRHPVKCQDIQYEIIVHNQINQFKKFSDTRYWSIKNIIISTSTSPLKGLEYENMTQVFMIC